MTGILNVADHHQRGFLGERIDEGGFRGGDDEHVGFVDRLPAADGGAVESEALLEGVGLDAMDRDGEMLLHSGEIHEAEIDRLDFLVLDELENFRWGFRRIHVWSSFLFGSALIWFADIYAKMTASSQFEGAIKTGYGTSRFDANGGSRGPMPLSNNPMPHSLPRDMVDDRGRPNKGSRLIL